MTAIRGILVASLLSQASAVLQAQTKSEQAPLRFYNGPVRIQRVSGSIDLADSTAPMKLTMLLRNDSTTGAQSVTVGFRNGASARVIVGPRDTAVSVIRLRTERTGDTTRSVSVDLSPQLDGLSPVQPPEEVDVHLLLPAGVPRLIRSSTELTKDSASGRVSYRLLRKGMYLTRLNLVYTTAPVTLAIDKRLTPPVITRAGPVTVTLLIRNVGTAPARGVVLKDSFDPRDFAGGGVGFSTIAGRPNDRRLIWSQTLGELAAGDSTTVTYVVRALMPVDMVSLEAVSATIGGHLVGVSNKVVLQQNKH